MQKHIVDVAIIFASLCFFLYFVLTLAPLFVRKPEKPARKPPPGAEAIAPVPATVLTDLVKAFAALVEALAKAGPALWSLIGSLLFFLIGALAGGVFS
jgi:Na+-transporting methylmalonyl-CoA/oxaloacetate decarboxylase gamma subunit